MSGLLDLERRLRAVENKQKDEEIEALKQEVAALKRLFQDIIWIKVDDRFGEGGTFTIHSGRAAATLPVGQWSLLSRVQFQEGIENALRNARSDPASPYSFEVLSYQEVLEKLQQK